MFLRNIFRILLKINNRFEEDNLKYIKKLKFFCVDHVNAQSQKKHETEVTFHRHEER